MSLRRNILLFHAGALGDFVVTWPLALALARVYPQSRVFYVTQRGKGQLAERVLRLESSNADGGWHAMYAAGAPSLPDPQAKLVAGAHTVVSFASSPGDTFSENVARLAPEANYLPLTVRPPDDFAGHVTEHLLAQLAPWPAVQAALVQVLRSVASRGVMGKAPAGTAVLVHPGSGSLKKCWPPDRFVSLIERLRGDGRPVRVVLGEVERELFSAADVRQLEAAADVVHPATYVDLLDEVTAAAAFVGNDTGPSHLAGIVGVPTVALFGPSNPDQWRPLGPRVRLVRAASMEQIAVGEVYDAVRSVLA